MLLRNPSVMIWRGHQLWTHGDARLLEQPLDALLCSKQCPGAKVVEAMDLAQRWRAEDRAVISGFHSPVEKECLRIFLHSPQPIVICPARGLDPFQLPTAWEVKFGRDELLIVSPFPPGIRRATRETAETRTRLVLALAARHSIIHATPGGLLEQLSQSASG